MCRTQGEHERVADYLTCLHVLMGRLSPPWTEDQMLACALRNMLPKLRIVIRIDEVRNFEHLESIAIECERVYDSAESYRAPPPPDRSMDSTLAYHPPKTPRPRIPTAAITVELPQSDPEEDKSPINSPNLLAIQAKPSTTKFAKRQLKPQESDPVVVKNPVSEVETATPVGETASTSGSQLTCWNCLKPQHTFRECTEPRRKFCFKCGTPDVTRPTCPKCQGNPKANH